MNTPESLIRLENTTGEEITVQLELTGLEHLLLPGDSISIDTDQRQGELHIQIGEQRVIVWGGVAANFMKA
jgi:hypothetical protein